jgi:hypothetical protein
VLGDASNRETAVHPVPEKVLPVKRHAAAEDAGVGHRHALPSNHA